MNQKNLLTKDGYQQLKDQLVELKKKQEHLISQIEEVAQPDESGEDGLVTQLKEELEVANTQIEQIEETLENSEIVNSKTSFSSIQVGCKVKTKVGSSTKEFYIVNQLESDPTQIELNEVLLLKL